MSAALSLPSPASANRIIASALAWIDRTTGRSIPPRISRASLHYPTDSIVTVERETRIGPLFARVIRCDEPSGTTRYYAAVQERDGTLRGAYTRHDRGEAASASLSRVTDSAAERASLVREYQRWVPRRAAYERGECPDCGSGACRGRRPGFGGCDSR